MRVLVFNDTSITGHYGCMAVMSAIDSGLNKAGITPVGYWPTGIPWEPSRRFIESLEINAIIVNGEGTIHSPHKYTRAADLLKLARYAKEKLKVPIFLINASLFNVGKANSIYLKDFRMIFTRETQSLKFCRSLNLQSICLPDLSLLEFVRLSSGINETKNGRNIVFTDSVLSDKSRHIHDIAEQHGGKSVSFYPNKGAKNLFRNFYPKVKSRARQLFGYDPLILRPNYANEMRSKKLLTPVKDASFFITGRFHGVVMAIATKTPFIAITSNTPKIEVTLRDVFDSTERSLSLKDISHRIENLKLNEGSENFSSLENYSIDRYVSFARLRTPRMFEIIAEEIAK